MTEPVSSVVLCVGLNVDDHEPETQLKDTLLQAALRGTITNVALFEGEWEGVKERCVQFRFTAFEGCLVESVRKMARWLRQDSIAVHVPGESHWRLYSAPNVILDRQGHSIEQYPVRV